MNTPDPAESAKVLKGLAALLTFLLILSNVMWYIAYNTAASPLDDPTPTPSASTTSSPSPTTTVTPMTTPEASPSASLSPSVAP